MMHTLWPVVVAAFVLAVVVVAVLPRVGPWLCDRLGHHYVRIGSGHQCVLCGYELQGLNSENGAVFEDE